MLLKQGNIWEDFDNLDYVCITTNSVVKRNGTLTMGAGIALDADLMRNPDLTLWFDVPPEVAAERLAAARAPDRFEAEGVEFFTRVARGYADRAAGATQRFARLDGAQPRAQVAAQMLAAVSARGWLQGATP